MLTHNYSQIKQNMRKLKRNPNSKDPHLDLGILYFKNKEHNKAFEHFEKAQALSKNDSAITKILAIASFSTRNHEEAKASFLKLLKDEPYDAEVCQYLSKIYLAENDVQKAIEYLKRASEINPADPEVWNDLGALSYSQNNMDVAEQCFLKSMESDSAYKLSYMNLVDLYLQQRRIKDAKIISHKYIKSFPGDPTGLKCHGMICRREGNFNEAIRYLLSAREREKRDADITYNLGLSFMSTGDFESASDYFKKTLDIDPTHVRAKKKLIACYCKLEGANSAFQLLKRDISDISWSGVRKHSRKRKRGGVKLSILVPAFNEAERILTNTREIKKAVSALKYNFEIVVVDDGSDDDTYEILELVSRTVKEVRPYKTKTNKGKGMALREASLKAKGDLVVFLDADLELHPRLISDMIQLMEETCADVVLGSKRHPDSKVKYPWHRRLLSELYYIVNRLLFRIPVKDTQTGIKVFKKEVLDAVVPRLLEKQYAFDLELIVNVHALGYKIVEAPITVNYSRGFGRIGHKAVIRTAMDTLSIFYRLKILKYYDRKQLPLIECPKVSIIVPYKGIGTYVRQCVEQCLKLDYPDFEVILLPDYPSDFTPNAPVKVVPTGARPPSEKRDLGVKEACGEIIAFLDDDAYPEEDWLKKVVRNFSDKEVAAVGGPAMTPEDDNFWQKLSGSIFSSKLVSGRFNYRYIPRTFQEVEDFPTCNLSVRKADFQKVDGFSTQYWPGEDTILCLKIKKELRKKIVYDPDAGVYHHRRELFKPHLRQVKSYALHRGFFAKKFPETSLKFSYFVPSLFVMTFGVGMGLSLFNPGIRFFYLGGLGLYFLSASCTQLLTFSLRDIFLGTIGIFLTHLTYGLYFIKGLFSGRLTQ